MGPAGHICPCLSLYSLAAHVPDRVVGYRSRHATSHSLPLFRKWTAHCSDDSLSSPSLLYGRKDVPFILIFRKTMHVTQYFGLAMTQCKVWRTGLDIYKLGFDVATRDSARIMLVDSAIVAFCIFAYCDLHRVGVCGSSLWLYVIAGIFVSVAFSPATTLAKRHLRRCPHRRS